MWSGAPSQITIDQPSWQDFQYPDKADGVELHCGFAEPGSSPEVRPVELTARVTGVPVGARVLVWLFDDRGPILKAAAVRREQRAAGTVRHGEYLVASFDLGGWDLDENARLPLTVRVIAYVKGDSLAGELGGVIKLIA